MRKRGFTLVEIMIVVAIIGLLAIMAMPSFLRAGLATRTNSCLNNLRQIDMAKDQWAIENNKNEGEPVSAANIDPYLKRKFVGTRCPASGAYTIGNVGTDPLCDKFSRPDHPATI